ncbi:LuxR C-terminal-related transcriptional regulator [Patulibacter americanus]|uniref:LuxR C-terminal-related transcriptional regulator n=1 Tax=Patulibacter americanus TaxID=588672 RepID=UPI0003B4A001|nr:LuxR C-terminal-related transcriptional regulator [Patulibacter americanus]
MTVRTGGRLTRTAPGDERLVGFRRTERHGRPAVELRIPNWVFERQEQEDPAASGRAEVDPEAAGVLVSRPGDDATHLTVTSQADAVDQEGTLLREAEVVTRSGSWELHADTGELRWSANMRRLFGLAPGDPQPDAETVAALVHPADGARIHAAIEAMREEGTLRPMRYRVVVDGRVRHLRGILGAVERDAAGRPVRFVGAVRDVTEQWETDQQVAAHMAVSEALAAWDGLEPGAERLLSGLAEALDGAGGVLWTEEDDALVARVVWADPYVPLEAFWAATHEARLRRGVEVAGAAWARGEPVFDPDGTIMRRGPRHAAARKAGLPAVLAIPALAGGEVVAVVEVPLREDGHVTEGLMRSLRGLGHEIGEFLGRRRGLLGAARLTARELEVLQLTARGLTTQQAAATLFISAATVKTHLAHIYAKLDASDAAAAVASAMRLGLIA